MVYSMSRNIFCERIGSDHKSNNVMYVVDLQEGGYYQKCYDPDCKGYRVQFHQSYFVTTMLPSMRRGKMGMEVKVPRTAVRRMSGGVKQLWLQTRVKGGMRIMNGGWLLKPLHHRLKTY